jgi:hypothetical protein
MQDIMNPNYPQTYPQYTMRPQEQGVSKNAYPDTISGMVDILKSLLNKLPHKLLPSNLGLTTPHFYP